MFRTVYESVSGHDQSWFLLSVGMILQIDDSGWSYDVFVYFARDA